MKKRIIVLIVFALVFANVTKAQVAINTDGTSADASAMLDVQSNSKGILFPRMTSAERQVISNPALGLIVFDTDATSLYFYTGSAWEVLSDGTLWSQSGNSTYLTNSDNKVGIGTSSPQYNLDVIDQTGPSWINISSGASYAGLFIDKHTASDNGYIVWSTSGTTQWYTGLIHDNNYSISKTHTSADGTFYIDSDGDIGFGTTSPQYNFNIYRNSANSIMCVESNGSSAGIILDKHSTSDDAFITWNVNGTSNWYSGLMQDNNFSISRNYTPDGTFYIKSSGEIGIGTTAPNELLEVAHPTNDYGRMIVSDGGGSSRNALLFVSPKASVQEARIEAYNYGTSTGLKLKFNTIGEGACVFGGKVGIGTTTPTDPLHVAATGDKRVAYFSGEGVTQSNATIYVENNSLLGGNAAKFKSTGIASTIILKQLGTGALIEAYGPSSNDEVWSVAKDGSMNFYNANYNRTIEIDPSESGDSDAGQITLYNASGGTETIKIDGNYAGSGYGRVTTNELQITGGSDLSEFFSLTSSKEIAKGMVVSIDENNPGNLKISELKYDKKVAGVVSGANNIRPGLIMSQNGTIADGEYLIALSGRVYCYVDATKNAIEVGDMLTTSDTPGYAMKVDNFDKARGSIIGKAMTSLKSGKGLVLVLVTLQ